MVARGIPTKPLFLELLKYSSPRPSDKCNFELFDRFLLKRGDHAVPILNTNLPRAI